MSRRQKRHCAPPDPEPWLRLLSPELRDNPKSVAWAKARLRHEEARREFKRVLVDFYDIHEYCAHGGCRRARRCVRHDVPCFDAVEPLFRKEVYPWLIPALDERAAQKQSAEADMPPESGL